MVDTPTWSNRTGTDCTLSATTAKELWDMVTRRDREIIESSQRAYAEQARYQAMVAKYGVDVTPEADAFLDRLCLGAFAKTG